MVRTYRSCNRVGGIPGFYSSRGDTTHNEEAESSRRGSLGTGSCLPTPEIILSKQHIKEKLILAKAEISDADALAI